MLWLVNLLKFQGRAEKFCNSIIFKRNINIFGKKRKLLVPVITKKEAITIEVQRRITAPADTLVNLLSQRIFESVHSDYPLRWYVKIDLFKSLKKFLKIFNDRMPYLRLIIDRWPRVRFVNISGWSGVKLSACGSGVWLLHVAYGPGMFWQNSLYRLIQN